MTERPLEQWEPVAGFPGYEVSELGRVRSLRGKWPVVLKPARQSRGYLAVNLATDDGKQHTKLVHRLVLEAFEGPCPPNHEAWFEREDRTDVRHVNLSWVSMETRRDRMIARGALLTGERNPNAKLTLETAATARKAHFEQGVSIGKIARILNVTETTIGDLIHGRTWNDGTVPIFEPTIERKRVRSLHLEAVTERLDELMGALQGLPISTASIVLTLARELVTSGGRG